MFLHEQNGICICETTDETGLVSETNDKLDEINIKATFHIGFF